jgi:hypothetical protein
VSIDGTAWLGFGGVLVGAAFGYASSAVQESARRRHERQRVDEQAAREDRIRFEDRRFDAYVAMVTAANRVYAAVKHPVTADPAAFTAQLHSAYEQFRTSLSPAFLLAATEATRDCIAELASATADLRQASDDRARPTPDDAELVPLFRAHRRTVKAAEAAMRDEFGLERLLPRWPDPAPAAPSAEMPDPAAPAAPAGPTDTARPAVAGRDEAGDGAGARVAAPRVVP